MSTVSVSRPASVRAPRSRLASFFAPTAIAVIGASPREGSVGRALLENVYEFGGPVFPVNPKHESILRLPAFSRVAAVPAKVDLALIATLAATVPDIMDECAAAGVKSAIVFSAGFKECGPEGRELERRTLLAAQRGGIAVLGPNCLGLMAPHRRVNATFATTMARPGNVAFVSQSGALCSAVLDWSLRENVGFSAFVSVGSMLDVGWAELIDYLGDDPHTRSIMLYMESIGDARSFLSAAREVAFSKPIIAVKVGRTEAAAQAAASHTGALTGRDDVLDAAFRRAGVLRVDTIEDLFDMAEVLGKQPRPRGPRLAIVTNAGGPAALAADRLALAGGELARFSRSTLDDLERALPAHWSHGNPVDILGDADDARFAKAVEIVARDPHADGILVVLTPQAMTDPLAVAERLRAFAASSDGRPMLASWMGGTAVDAGEDALNRSGIPTFRFPDRAAQAFDYMWRYSRNVEALFETPTLSAPEPADAERRERAEGILNAARREKRLLLTQHESKRVLAAYGLPVVEAIVATDEEQAVANANRIGFPVAVKLHSQTITHKATVGGVVLNVRRDLEVRDAWRAIKRAVAEKAGGHHFLGVTVERMETTPGLELILGSSIDPQFGPVLLFGTGGRLVEVVRDTALGLPPLTSTLARRLMEQTRVHRSLVAHAARGSVDLGALEQIVVRFSQLVVEQPRIKEIEINPLLAAADRVVALDARIVLHDAELADGQLPRPAIRPYPQAYVTSCMLRDGTRLQLRPIRAEDEPLMVRFHRQLSDRSVYYRYFTAVSLAQRTDHTRLARLCFVDYDREIALVAVREAAPAAPEIVGIGRLCRVHGKNEAEFAVLVVDRWQRRGLGTQLLRNLVQIGRQENLQRITGMMLADNVEMRRTCERVGFTVSPPRDGECSARLVL